MTRRKLFSGLLAGIGVGVVGAVVAPSFITALSPVVGRRRESVWRSVDTIDTFPVGDVTRAFVRLEDADFPRAVGEKGVYVYRQAAEDFVVFSRNCTDLSCPVTWDPGSEWFFCPCHGGIFSKEGERMAGPPKRPLYRYAFRVRDNVLEIDLNSLPPMT